MIAHETFGGRYTNAFDFGDYVTTDHHTRLRISVGFQLNIYHARVGTMIVGPVLDEQHRKKRSQSNFVRFQDIYDLPVTYRILNN